MGAGAAGAALAWSLADTRMRIVCLEQGGWMNPAEYPTNRIDWEMQRFGAFGLSPEYQHRLTQCWCFFLNAARIRDAENYGEEDSSRLPLRRRLGVLFGSPSQKQQHVGRNRDQFQAQKQHYEIRRRADDHQTGEYQDQTARNLSVQ